MLEELCGWAQEKGCRMPGVRELVTGHGRHGG